MKSRLQLRHGNLGRKEVTSHEAFREASSWSVPWLTTAQPSPSTAQRQHVDLTTHSAEDEVSHDGLSPLPISYCNFAFVVGAKVDAVASSWLHG